MPSTTLDDLREFVRGLATRPDFGDDDQLFDTGIIQSLHMLELFGFIEDRFHVPITPADVFDGHFTSVARMAAFVDAARR